jgi:transposase-like protein
MKNAPFFKLTGEVEVDETFLGGEDKNRHWNKKSGLTGSVSGKTAVIGAIARKGNVVCQVIEGLGERTLTTFVKKTVGEKVSLVATDEATGYGRLKQWYPHETVNHKKKEYVRGNVHTANLDSFWSLLKRGVMGTFHNVSKAYLPLYLSEFSFRHNNRENPDIFGAVVAGC